MASRLLFHTQLSSIMETMARCALSQVCELVDEDSAELRLELSRLMVANSALTEKVNSLECELTIVRSDPPDLYKRHRSVGVQTISCRDGDASVSGPPTIEGIFGKDWCMNLWKDSDPYSLERVTDSPQNSEKIREKFTESVATLSDQITVTEIKEGDYEEASSCQQETPSTEVHEESMAEEPEQLSDGFSADGITCSLSLDQDGEDIVSAGGIEELSKQLIPITDTEEAISAHIFPIEDDIIDDDLDNDDDDDDDDDVQFVHESPQQPTINTGGPRHNKQQTSPVKNSENNSALDEDSRDDFNRLNVETATDPNKDRFTCHICSRTFIYKATLANHMKSHKANICSICKQQFPNRKQFNLHTCMLSVRSQRVSKSCEVCGKTFANPSALRVHHVVHTGQKPYSCSYCGKGFTQKGNLKCHLRIHTGERPFCCVKCGRTFTQKVSLKHHLVVHRNRDVVRKKPVAMRQLNG